MSQQDIAVALEKRLALLNPPLPTVFENEPYPGGADPEDGVAYQEANVLFAEPINDEQGSGYVEHGYLAVLLKFPKGEGAGASQARADALRAHFPRLLPLTEGGATVTITHTPEITRGRVDGERYVRAVNVRFRAYFAS